MWRRLVRARFINVERPEWEGKHLSIDVDVIARKVKEHHEPISRLKTEVGRIIVGQERMVEGILLGLLAGGHVLLEGVPGLAKTLTVTTIARAMKLDFRRIQFTPDLLPADLVGTLVYNPNSGEFAPKKGPIFTNIALADEINRAPAKVQSALLESMQEHQVTIGEVTYALPTPFMVLATQNPIEQEGTYPLPEAQVDRFFLKLKVDYPTKPEERRIMDAMAYTSVAFDVQAVFTPEELFRARDVVNQIYVDDKVKDYIIEVVFATRDGAAYGLDTGALVQYGASPRATIYLALAARARAFLAGRGYVTPQDVKAVGFDVLRHRIILTYEAEAEEVTTEDIIQKIFDHVEVP